MKNSIFISKELKNLWFSSKKFNKICDFETFFLSMINQNLRAVFSIRRYFSRFLFEVMFPEKYFDSN